MTWLEACEAWLEAPEAWLEAPEAWFEDPVAWIWAPEAWPEALEALLGGTYVRTDGRTHKIPLFYRTSPPSGPLPKNDNILDPFFLIRLRRICSNY